MDVDMPESGDSRRDGVEDWGSCMKEVSRWQHPSGFLMAKSNVNFREAAVLKKGKWFQRDSDSQNPDVDQQLSIACLVYVK